MQITTIPTSDGRRIVHSEGWRVFLGAAHRSGLKVHALDGDPRYALRSSQALALAVVDAVVAYNQPAPADERFDGVHFDNEPYLLLEWQDPSSRERLLESFLDLNARALGKAHAAGIEYGIDIPFWWQARDDETGDVIGAVTFRGVRKAASFHCLDLLDNVGIMDYRNVSAGRDGIIAHARDLLEYADRVSRAKVYVGVETSSSADATYWFVTGIPRADFRDVVSGRARGLEAVTRSHLTIVTDGATVHLGVRVSARPALREASDAVGTLGELARLLHAPAVVDGEMAPGDDAALAALAREGEWRTIQADTFVDPVTHRVHRALRALRVMLPKLTFVNKTNSEMERELAVAEDAFVHYASYAGIAIHDWESYRMRFDELKVPPKPASRRP